MSHRDSLPVEAERYADQLGQFIERHDLPAEWFAVPDHLAIKCADADDFEDTLEAFRGDAEQISWIAMQQRRLATVRLSGALAVGQFDSVGIIEIMEPKPAMVGMDVVGLEHMEFYFPELLTTRRTLHERGVEYEVQGNPNHHWISIILNNQGQELKLNDKLLADITAAEIASGEAHLL